MTPPVEAPPLRRDVPAWLAELGVKSGGYFIDSKARAKRAMKSNRFSPAARIHICLGLATMGYQQELAVKMEGGKRVLLTPADICAATGILRQNFRRYMTELEGCGLAECRGSTKGRVEIYAWAIPHSVDVKKIVIAHDDNLSGCSPDLIPILKHYRIRLPNNFVIARDCVFEMERLALMTFEAESSLRAYANGLRARGRLNKEERNERNIERNEEAVGRQVAPAPPDWRTYLPTTPVPAEVMTTNSIPGLDALIRVIEDVAVPAIGESPTLNQSIEIHRRLNGASLEHFRARLEAKAKQGKLNSVMVLGHLAEDCAKNKDKWKPPQDAKGDRRGESIKKVIAMAEALRGGTL